MNISITLILQMAPIIAMISLMIQKSHMLMALLSLEGIMLSMVLLVPSILAINGSMINSVSVIMLSFGACEASLGLSLMVLLSRSYGSDLMNSMTMNKC